MCRALGDLLGGLRSTGRELAAEGRTILAEADAPQVERPGLWRRGWRRFRRLPRIAQILVGLALFALWCWIVYTVWVAPGPQPRLPHTTTNVTI